MSMFIYLKKFLYFVIVLSVLTVIGSAAAYYKMEQDIEEELLVDYNYEQIQDIVISDESTNIPKFDVEQLLGINGDFCGWLYIPDTPVNYPVVQGDDNEYYLDHSFEKEYSKFGCIFMMAGAGYDDDNIILHGHNMGSGREEMFSSLLKYENIEYAEAHKELWFSHINEEKEVKYQVFAVLNYDFGNPDDFYYMISNFDSREDYSDFVQYLITESTYDSGFIPEDQLLILSTCYNIYGDNHRMLVCAARVDGGMQV